MDEDGADEPIYLPKKRNLPESDGGRARLGWVWSGGRLSKHADTRRDMCGFRWCLILSAISKRGSGTGVGGVVVK